VQWHATNQRDRRRYATIEADKLGTATTLLLLGRDHKMLIRRLEEIDHWPDLSSISSH